MTWNTVLGLGVPLRSGRGSRQVAARLYRLGREGASSGDVFSRVRGWRVVEGCFGHCEKGARS